MWPSTIEGVIRRRLLINFRTSPEVASRVLPERFRPKVHAGWAMVGICLIRLEAIRPKGFPAFLGISSENAAHRIAVTWMDEAGSQQEGVYIPRRDTSAWPNHLAGGRLFPGEHHLSRFQVEDDGLKVSLRLRARDGVEVTVVGNMGDHLPGGSIFGTLQESSDFFQMSSTGYSATKHAQIHDGVRLSIGEWKVAPFEIEQAESSYFQDPKLFPSQSVVFDHALIMRNISHEWQAVPPLHSCPAGGCVSAET